MARVDGAALRAAPRRAARVLCSLEHAVARLSARHGFPGIRRNIDSTPCHDQQRGWATCSNRCAAST